MKAAIGSILILFLAGCEQVSQPDQIFSNAKYAGNVSSIYRIGALGDGAQPTDFSWHDSSGTIRSLSDYKGKDVLLNFWATWCGYCVTEIPALDSLSSDSSAIVIGVSIDNSGNSFNSVQNFAGNEKVNYQLVIDSSESLFIDYIAAANGTDGIPETFVIGKDGTIKFLLIGQQSEESFRKYLGLAN